MSPVISLSRVTKVYPGNVTALRGVDLTVERGESLAVVGPSGSGKSTLLQIVGTLDRPTSGTVTIAGHDVGTLSDRGMSALRARSIGFVFQRFHLAPGLSALENVAEGLLYGGAPRGERRNRAAEALERVGLAHRLGHRPDQLSGGERQRVAIARAVVGNPPILLADEPTGNLDSVAGEVVVEILTRLNEQGTTLVVITHDPEVAARFGRRAAVRDGRLIGADPAPGEPPPAGPPPVTAPVTPPVAPPVSAEEGGAR
ncbi:ABC transporter ATP-binding protein [Bailinhaonella thermotolerans]|uniref:ABC transporter ATP-binding protein n=1 Tax=Bailinhaonella thermotolerans TaxID=1070861 RepID=A0A3A4AYQ6_9ACTN|nr:ABC transporter ATP-binding protein [Bailinhaonella thermotolerans]RJL30987.1 ABC transporter ATP-binding protein [Bailinhaonella thermotolerans]